MIVAENVAASMFFSSLTVNVMLDKAELNNRSELSTIKTLCEKRWDQTYFYTSAEVQVQHILGKAPLLYSVSLSLFSIFVFPCHLDFLSLPLKLHIL